MKLNKFFRSLPLYAGAQVAIRIGDYEYQLPKALLCRKSPYFAAAFEGKFQEGMEQAITLPKLDGVVSVRSFEMLIQWLYLGRVVLKQLPAEEEIDAIIEFVRIADMCQISGMESSMAERIKTIVMNTPERWSTVPEELASTYNISSEHIISAANLPDGHPVRCILAAAAVEGYLQYDDHKFKCVTEQVHNFSVDLLKAVKTTLKSSKRIRYHNHLIVKHPITDKDLNISYTHDKVL
jgi:hypothetical protein